VTPWTVTAEVGGQSQSFEGDEVLLGAGTRRQLHGVEQAGSRRTLASRSTTHADEHQGCLGDRRLHRRPALAKARATSRHAGEVAVDTILGQDASMDYDVGAERRLHASRARVGRADEAQAKESTATR